jgi:hypothetical protein
MGRMLKQFMAGGEADKTETIGQYLCSASPQNSAACNGRDSIGEGLVDVEVPTQRLVRG